MPAPTMRTSTCSGMRAPLLAVPRRYPRHRVTRTLAGVRRFRSVPHLRAGPARIRPDCANAAPAPQPYTCQNQYLDGGTFGPLTVKGWCEIGDESTVTVKGNVTVANGAGLYVDYYSTLRVRGNVTLQSGSALYAEEYSTTAVGTTSAPGDLTVGSNAAVFADYYGSTFHVYGSLSASNNSFLALGCTEAHPCEEVPESDAVHTMSISQAPKGNHVIIGGNAFLAQVLNATIDGVNIGGNMIISGGGDAQG